MTNKNNTISMIETPYGDLFFKKWNATTGDENSPPLILLHDSLGCAQLWKDLPALLANTLKRDVIAYDRLGFGQSEPRQRLPEFDFIEQEALLFFPLVKKHLGIEKYALLGHSVGGAMALNIAAEDDDCIAVISLSAQAFVEERTLEGIHQSRDFFRQSTNLTRLEKWHGTKAKWVLDAWTEVWLAPEFATWSILPTIKQVNCPTLIIHGDKDEYGSIAFPNTIRDNVSGFVEQAIIADCGHVPYKEKPRETLLAIEHFAEQLI